jgi:hypothetical protein
MDDTNEPSGENKRKKPPPLTIVLWVLIGGLGVYYMLSGIIGMTS